MVLFGMIRYTLCCGLTVVVHGANPGEFMPFAQCPRCAIPLFEEVPDQVVTDGTEERFRRLELE